ncbi:isoprenoid synthase domain-containing protein [Mycena rosella]|uniref:(2E,6E)-farnesyl diphosphate synthase n=1 Tax=Mycena rosella TaxID=1033263 RepID=A0AAD7FFC8_MYCRO|nr:isoprenoid synthase domain-containing protein [Mycena rosella]
MRRWTDASSALVRTRTRCKARPYSFLAQKQAQLPEQTRRDPAALVAPELDHLRQSLLAKYYFLHPSKQMRPLLVLLFARATNGLGEHWRERHWAAECEGAGGRAEELDRPLTRADVLNDWNPSMPDSTTSFDVPALASPFLLLPTQRRLAQIVEMIHVASLLHDDVIDTSTLRRGVPSAPAAFGNKLSVLGGDFLLGRASTALSRLGDFEVVELIASVIANLVEGEILQMKDVYTPELGLIATPTASKEAWSVYLKKTYLKTASLMAKGCRASVILGGCSQGEVWKEVAYAFGRNFGLAFQLVDDVLDYEAGEATLGKPGGADLQLGLATGPALYAWEEHPEMGSLILRKFENEGDVELARDLVRRSSGARELLQLLPDSDAKVSLEMLTERVVTRTW